MAEVILTSIGIYAGIGLLFAAWFVVKGVATMDPVAIHAPWSFRALIFPGVAALWPVVLKKSLAARRSSRA